MDPDAALHDLRDAIRAWQEAAVAGSADAGQEAAAEFVSTAEALDGWLSRGGHLPAAWSPPPDQAVPDPDVAYAAYAEAARRFGRALACKVATRIRVDFPAATSIHTVSESCDDHDLHIRLVAVGGPTGLLADSRSGADAWDELTDEVDPDLDWLGLLEPDDWTGRQELDLVPLLGPLRSTPDPTPAHPIPAKGTRP